MNASDSILDLPNSKTTLAILLGASEFPRQPADYSHHALAASAARFRGYLLSSSGLALPPDNVCDCFDREMSTWQLTDTIREFVRDRVAALAERALEPRDAIVYYAGHGAFPDDEQVYFLYLRGTDPDLRESTSLQSRQLREALTAGCANMRQLLIIDACFAARTIDAFQHSAVLSRPSATGAISTNCGVAILASSNRDRTSRISEDGHYTAFSKRLLDILETGDAATNGALSLRRVSELLVESIQKHSPAEPWPELHSPTGIGGLIFNIPFFPNSATRGIQSTHSETSLSTSRTAARSITSTVSRITKADVRRLESTLSSVSEHQLIEASRLIGERRLARGAIILFHCLAHSSADVRSASRKAIKSITWPGLSAEISRRLAAQEVEHLDIVLTAADACRAHPQLIEFLRSLCSRLSGSQRTRAQDLLLQKEARLNADAVRTLFKKLGGQIRIETAIGVGAVTVAYRAFHEGLQQQVVVRMLREPYANDVALTQQFRQLSIQTAKLRHEHLVQTLDIPALPLTPHVFMVRTFIDGAPLRDELLNGRRFVPSEILLILKALAKALVPFFESNLCHTGVRPSNIFLINRYPRVVLGDPSPILRTNVLPVETVGVNADRLTEDYCYTAPEVHRGTPSPMSDQYSLGCVAYELLCGSLPFTATNRADLVAMHLGDSPPLPSSAGSKLGSLADHVVRTLLEKEPVNRYRDPLAVLRALEEVERLWATGADTVGKTAADKFIPPQEPGDDASSDSGGRPAPPNPPSSPPASGEVNPITESSWHFEARPLQSVVDLDATNPIAGSEDRVVFRDSGLLGRMIGRYHVLDALGSGGMGSVFKAFDPTLSREVAIKVVRSGLGSTAEQLFFREARALAKLTHPNICPIYDVGQMPSGGIYLVLELVLGYPLSNAATRENWSNSSIGVVVQKIARAMQYAHDAGFIHRDLKPMNILINESQEPKILDFGLAMSHSESAADPDSLIRPGMIVGTPAYMSPEQYLGNVADARTDVYGLGCILYELLAGRRPWEGYSRTEMMERRIRTMPPPLFTLMRDRDRDLDAICTRMLMTSPDDRYSTMSAVADDLARWSEGKPVSARRAPVVERAIQWLRRHLGTKK